MKRLPMLAALAAVPAWAQEPAPSPPPSAPAAPAAPQSAVGVLVQQAQHWLDQGRPELADLSIQRAIAAEPHNPQLLLLAIKIAAARNNREAAGTYAAQLRSTGATPQQLGQADNEIRAASVDRNAIDQARRLARDNRPDEAAAAYRAAFGGHEPPAVYAREYYQTLAATTASREVGQRGLGQLAAQPGADDRTLLANAEQLTYTQSSRADGIRRLAELASKPGVGADAQRAWKQALGFYGADASAAPLIEDYLRRYPGDADMQRRLEAARAAPASTGGPGGELRQRGFAELQSGGLQRSGQNFASAIAIDPKDADALGGLGIVRLREKQAAEARSLLERAIAADPAKADQWRRALDAANYSLELTEARQDLRRGDATAADTVLRRAVARDVDDRADAENMLGEAALRRGDAAEAERDFRTALAHRPRFAPAVTGLADALRKEGRVSEANALHPPAAPVADSGPPDTTSADVTRMRAEATDSADPREQAAVLSKAMAMRPTDPWVRLDLARALRRMGRQDEGRSIVEDLAARSSTPDANYAAALFAQETGRPADAEAFLARIPPQRRTADMTSFASRIRGQADVARAAALLPSSPLQARQQLLALAAQPDQSGETAANAIRDLGNAGDLPAAAEAARAAERANPGGNARIAIAGALLAAGLDKDAAALAERIDPGSLTQAQQRDLAALRNGSAIRAADKLNEAGNQSAAYETLRPALASNPNEPQVQLALARLYQGARQPAEALRIAETVLARNPRDWDARQGAVEAAIAAGDLRRADALATEARAMAPNDSRALYMQARVAQARGNNVLARSLLTQAAKQRDQELGRQQGATVLTTSNTPKNPFAGTSDVSSSAVQSGDPLSREIGQQLEITRLQTAPLFSATGTVRIRSGVAGLDSLNEIATPLEASGPLGTVPGRFIAKVTPVFLNSGQLDLSNSQSLRFGTNALATHPASPSSTADGVGLSFGYKWDDTFAADVGTSPLGFRTTNVVGGLEVAPRLTDTLRLRVQGERRSVIDSLLSYGGQRDPLTGQTWGGVTQTGGRVQLEATMGAGSAYALAGYASLDGDHVAHNTRREAGAGFSYPVWKQGDSSFTTGLDFVYFAYDNNQRGFTYGQGGYFSPQNYVALNLPLQYRSKWGKLGYTVGGTIGYAHFREDSSPLFPDDPALQSQVEAASLLNTTIPTHNQGQIKNGLTGGLRVELNYPLTDSLSLIGAARYDKAADFDETRVRYGWRTDSDAAFPSLDPPRRAGRRRRRSLRRRRTGGRPGRHPGVANLQGPLHAGRWPGRRHGQPRGHAHGRPGLGHAACRILRRRTDLHQDLDLDQPQPAPPA